MGEADLASIPGEQLKATRTGVSSILKFPPELISTLSSHLSTDDLRYFRLVCKQIEALLFETFAKRHFRQLYILPTANALTTLNQIANTRLKHYVKELFFWPSIYQYGKDSVPKLPVHVRGGRTVRGVSTYIVDANDLPYRDPAWRSETAANNAVLFLKSGGLETQLTATLGALRINRITIQSRTRGVVNVREATRLRQETRFDPRSRFYNALWDYACPDIITSFTNAVLNAVATTGTPLSTLVIDPVQDDQLEVFKRERSKPNASEFFALENLAISEVMSEPLQSELIKDGLCINSNHVFGLSPFLNNLPKLESLDVTFPKLDQDVVLLRDMLRSSRLQHLRRLCLGTIRDAESDLIPFLAGIQSTLRDLKLIFRIRNGNDASPAPWRDLFSRLGTVLSLEKLVIDMYGLPCEAYGERKIEGLLEWIMQRVPIDWANPETSDEEDQNESDM